MAQNRELLTRETNPISLVSTRAGTLERYPVATERRMPMSTTGQSWTLQVAERIPVSDIPERVNPLLKIVKRFNRLGSGTINESRLESRHNIPQNFRINGIGL
jgi:hypothetical protein